MTSKKTPSLSHFQELETESEYFSQQFSDYFVAQGILQCKIKNILIKCKLVNIIMSSKFYSVIDLLA